MKTKIILSQSMPEFDHGRVIITSFPFLSSFTHASLASNGVKTFTHVPDSFIVGKSYNIVAEKLRKQICGQLEKDKLNIVGMSHYTGEASLSLKIAQKIRHYAHHFNIPLMLVGGGPFFARQKLVRDGKEEPDSVISSISHVTHRRNNLPIYDGVVYGGLQAFVDLIKMARHGSVKKKGHIYVPSGESPRGYYYGDRENMHLIGKGKSPLAKMDYFPVSTLPLEKGFDLEMMFSNNCANRCGFCMRGVPFRFSPEQVGERVKRVMKILGKKRMKELNRLGLMEPNPLSPANRTHTYKCLDEVASALGYLPTVNAFVDSALFMEPTALWRYLIRANMSYIAVGREVATEYSADLIGAKAHRNVKTQDQLDAEKQGLEEIIHKAKETGQDQGIKISYIISPLETYESINATFEEMAYFKAMEDENFKILIDWAMLTPLPGTSLLEEQYDIVTPSSFFAPTPFHMWDEEAIKQKHPESVFPQLLTSNMVTFYGCGFYSEEYHETIRNLKH